jgi:hypothetical protein
MIALRVLGRGVRRAILETLRALLPGRVVFRLLGVPAGTIAQGELPQVPVYDATSRRIPPPRTVDAEIHGKFRPGSDPFLRSSGWFFERSFVVPVPEGTARATGVSFTASGHALDLGPGLVPPPSTYGRPFRPFARTLRIDDPVATLTTSWDSNYFHWLFDVLPRLRLVEQAGLEPRWIYAARRLPFQRDTLLALGYGTDTILDAAAIPEISARELIVPSLPGTPGVMPEWVCEFLRERLAPAAPTGHRGPGRIYISRAGARSRRIVNESRLLDVLARHGFVTVRLETMPFADQVRTFQSARCIVAPHGAGLANLVFCRPGASVIELLPAAPGKTNVCYWLLSQQAALTYHYVLASAASPGTDLEVDLDKVARTVDAALSPSMAAVSLRR